MEKESVQQRTDVAPRLQDVLLRLFGRAAPVLIHAWDGSRAGPDAAPAVTVRSRRALRRLLWRPDELGLARAYVAGELEVVGGLLAALERLAPYARFIGRRPDLDASDRRELLRTAVALGAVGPPPAPPPEEIVGAERRQALAHDRMPIERAGIDWYDGVGVEFAGRVLGPTFLFATGYWVEPSYDLAAAQNAGVDLACQRLALTPGARLLDVDCGWGSFLLRAVRSYDVTAVGATLSGEQAEIARRRIAEAGLSDRIRIHHGDWRELDAEPFDAITGSGLGDYVAAEGFGAHASALAERLRPDGRLVLDQVSRREEPATTERSFIDAYVSPGAELPRLGDLVGALEVAGFEVREVESLREHQARTVRAWLDNLEAAWAGAPDEVPPSRLRVWQLYLAVSALAFEAGRIGVHQVVAVRQPAAPLP